jgi:hypothetical protein
MICDSVEVMTCLHCSSRHCISIRRFLGENSFALQNKGKTNAREYARHKTKHDKNLFKARQDKSREE